MSVRSGSALVAGVLLLSGCAARPPTGAATAAARASATASEDPYAGWNTYTAKWERVSFSYPPSWSFASRAVYPSCPDGFAQDLCRDASQVTLHSDSGFTIRFEDFFYGLGGGCDPETQPHIFIDRVLEMPPTGGRFQLAIVLVSLEGHKVLAIMDRVDRSPGLEGEPNPNFGHDWSPGDTGDCLLYLKLPSSTHETDGDPGTVQFTTGTSLEVHAGTTPNDHTDELTDDQYLAQPDVQTAIEIFRSLRYTS